MSRPDVIVVGGGIIGVTTAYELASRGCRTTLFEAAGMLGWKPVTPTAVF